MKNAIRTLTALAAALLMATAASAAAETDKQAKPLPVIADGMAPLTVTSSTSDFCADTAVLFDGKADTFTALSIDEETVDKVFTLKTATGIPEALSAVALITKSDNGAELNVRIWGTNDSLEQEWTPLSFSLTKPIVQTGDWHVLNLAEPEGGWKNAVKYAFYKIELSLNAGTSADFSECFLIRPDLGEPKLAYESVEAVEEGQTPPVVAVSVPAEPEPAASVLPRRLSRGLFWPGFTK